MQNIKLKSDLIKSKREEDEWEMMREKSAKVDLLENEVITLSRNLTEAKEKKSRLEELLADNKTLERKQEVLEKQLEEARDKAKKIFKAESELLKQTTLVNSLQLVSISDYIIEKDRLTSDFVGARS